MNTIKITADEIAAAREIETFDFSRKEYTNPVALAMTAAGYSHAWANRYTGLIGWTKDEVGCVQSMAPEAKSFLIAFDNYEPIQNVSFEVH